jgi:hypothetical protein
MQGPLAQGMIVSRNVTTVTLSIPSFEVLSTVLANELYIPRRCWYGWKLPMVLSGREIFLHPGSKQLGTRVSSLCNCAGAFPSPWEVVQADPNHLNGVKWETRAGFESADYSTRYSYPIFFR